jgi:phosphotransferase system IIB component
MDYKKIAEEILDAIGGKENVAAAAHCATRLRMVLNDEENIEKAKLENGCSEGYFFYWRAISDYPWIRNSK